MGTQAIKDHVKRVWKGEEPFWKMFLIWWVAGTFVIVTGVANILVPLVVKDVVVFPDLYAPIFSVLLPLLAIPVFLLIPVYFIFLTLTAIRRFSKSILKNILGITSALFFGIFTVVFFFSFLMGTGADRFRYGFWIWDMMKQFIL